MTSTILPAKVRIVDVGPYDGLQNEPLVGGAPVPTAVKIELIERLAAAGLPAVGATAFVSPRWVPQMADQAEAAAVRFICGVLGKVPATRAGLALAAQGGHTA